LFESIDFQVTLLPHLERLSSVMYVDPSLYKTDEEFQYALKVANIEAGSYAKLLKFLKSQRITSERLIKQIEDIKKKQDVK